MRRVRALSVRACCVGGDLAVCGIARSASGALGSGREVITSNKSRVFLKTATLAFLAALAMAQTSWDKAQLSAGKKKYSMGEPVTIIGAGFAPNVMVHITVARPDKVTDLVLPSPTADANGAFTAQ